MSRKANQGITLGALSIALIAMTIVLVLALIKIYLNDRIYYESRQMHTLEQEAAALKEENVLLQMRVEQLRYKSQITDTIFTLEDTDQTQEDDIQ